MMHKLLSASALGAITMTLVTPAMAQGFGIGGQSGFNSSFDRPQISAEAKAAIEACREEEDPEAHKECMDDVREEYDLPERRGRGNVIGRMMRRGNDEDRPQISAEAKAAIEACHEEEDLEAKKSCMDEVRAEFDLPEKKQGRMRLMGRIRENANDEDRPEISAEAKAAIEACREEEDREAHKECMDQVREEFDLPERRGRGNVIGRMMRRGNDEDRPQISDEAKAAIEACREEEDREAHKECMDDVREEYDLPEAKRGIGQRIGRRVRGAFGRNSDISAEVRAELKACRDEDSREEVRSCMQEVRARRISAQQ